LLDVCFYMVKGQCADSSFFSLCRSGLTSIAAEYDDIQQRVAHQTVTAMDTANSLTGNIQVFNAALAIGSNIDTAVLIMQSRVNQDRFLADIDIVFSKHTHHSRN